VTNQQHVEQILENLSYRLCLSMQFVRCRPVNVEASLAAASAADELIDSLGVCAAISTVSRYLPHSANTTLMYV